MKCLDCQAIIGFEEKTFDENKPIYGNVNFCPYCGKRSLE